MPNRLKICHYLNPAFSCTLLSSCIQSLVVPLSYLNYFSTVGLHALFYFRFDQKPCPSSHTLILQLHLRCQFFLEARHLSLKILGCHHDTPIYFHTVIIILILLKAVSFITAFLVPRTRAEWAQLSVLYTLRPKLNSVWFSQLVPEISAKHYFCFSLIFSSGFAFIQSSPPPLV